MRVLLSMVACLIAATCLAVAAEASSTMIGNMKFDFDAPSAPLTPSQQVFFRKYKDAVTRHDKTALMSLQDESAKGCVIPRQMIERDVNQAIPDNAKVRFFNGKGDLAKEMGMGDMAYLPVQPTAVFGIYGRITTPQKIQIVTILRPVRQVGTTFTLVPYCLTEKGKAIFEKKQMSQTKTSGAR